MRAMTASAAGYLASARTAARAGRIGPNAVTRVADALEARLGTERARALFAAAGLAHHLARPPEHMVPEDDVSALHATLRRMLGPAAATAVSLEAGARTGDYLLAHRIPCAAQAVLRVLPAPLAARVLAGAIARHAWTFAGSGTFTFAPGRPLGLSIAGCPLCRDMSAGAPACGYYAATFERIFRALASPRARVREVACAAVGAPACSFVVEW
jgi:divinyl protochlorophyllide a 8-vinyl-reductase